MLKKRATPTVFILFAFMIAAALLSAAQISPAAQASKSPGFSRIVAPVDEKVRTPVLNSVHPMARSRFDVGALDGNTRLERMILVMTGSEDQRYQARTLIDSQQTKGSPNYHEWLTPEQYGQKFGPSAQDLAQVTAWLQQHGFTVGKMAKSGLWLEFSGSSAQVESAFQTQMRQYMVNGELHVANATGISIPAALSPVVLGVASLHNFHSQPQLQHSHVDGPVTLQRGQSSFTSGQGNHFLTPGDIATIYNLNPLFNGATPINGTGQTIGIVAVGNINLNDISTFRSVFGLSANAPNVILNGPDPGVGFASDEASIDVEYSGALAPNATVDIVVSGGSLTTDPVALSSSFIVDENLADVMSVSFGACEQALGATGQDGTNFWNNVWEQAAAQGISVFVSSGDTGAAGCDPNGGTAQANQGLGINGFGSTDFNTSVGGSEFNEGAIPATFWSATNNPNFSSALGYIPEMVWNDSCSPTTANSFCARQNVFSLASGSGGISAVNPLPSYQTLNIQGLSGANFPARVIPDVSLSAANDHDPYIFCFTAQNAPQDCQVSGSQLSVAALAGGTSFSSPEFAGIMALVDQAITGRQGLANFVLYSLAQTESAGGFGACNSSNRTNPALPASNACVFNDITAGNNGVPGNDTLSAFVPPGDTAGQLGYNATAGFDPAIGLGSVNAATLVNAWHSAAAVFHGSATTFTVNGATNAVTITHGQSVTVNASVTKMPGDTTTATPKGEVSLIASGGNLPTPGKAGIGFAAISGTGGTATTASNVAVTNLPGGMAYGLMARFPGDGVFAGSTSNSITVTVSPENSTTTLNPLIFNQIAGTLTSGTTVAYGDPVNILVIDAHTLGASQQLPALGSVNFNITGNPSVPLAIDNSGIAELADCFAPLSSCLVPGTYTITGAYSGDGLSYNASPASAPVTITVTKGTPAPALTAPATIGAGVAFTLTVSIGTGFGTIVPTGTVQFMDGTTALGGPVTLSAGQASMPVTLNAGGNHSLTAQYSGDATYNVAASAPLLVNVQAPFNLAATVNAQTIAAGQSATFNVTLNGVGGFSGTVNFNCTGAPNGSTCAVSPTSANLSSTTSSVPLTVTVSNTAHARMERPFRSLPFVFAGLLGVVVLGLKRNPRSRLLMLATLLIVLVAGVSSCGGNKTPAPPTNATLTVTGTSGNVSSAVTLNLTVTH
jgi:hypothetical protein